MAITRIKNNQITDGTIEAGKIANTTITGGKLENNMTYGSNLTISGNLTVNGTTTTVDSTTTQVADPLLLLSRGATGSASVDAGLVIERGDDDNVAMIWDESADQFIVAVTASEDGTTAGNVTVSSYANLQAGTVTVSALSLTGTFDADNIRIDGNTISSTDTNGNINLTPDGTGEVVASTLTVSDLTDNRVVIAGSSGALEDDANFTFDGTSLALTAGMDITGDLDVDNLNLNGNTIISTDTNGAINLTPNGTGEVVLSTATVSDLTDNRVVIAGTSGALEDDANFTYDGTDLTVNSAIVGDLTDNRVVIAGTSGALEDDANFTFDGTTMAITAAVDVTGDLDVDNININGNTIISTDTNGNISLTPNGTGEVVASTLTVSDLTDNRLVVAGSSGALEDDANLTWDATNLAVTGGVDVTGDLDVDNINVNGNAITSTDTNGNITITPNGTGDLVLDGLNWPQADGSADYVLKTDGSAQLSWTAVLTSLLQDTTPQLGGDLDVNGQKIVSARSNEDIVLEPNGTGEVVLSTAVVSDLTDNRIVVAGTAGALEDDANLTWDGSDMGVTGGLNVTGDITIDNLSLNGNTLASTDSNGAVNVTPNGTGTIELGGTSTVVNINGTTSSTSSTTGALVVDGGAGIAENLEVGGNIVVAGNLTVEGTTTTVDSVTTQVVDPIFQIGGGAGGAALTSTDSKDRGMSAKYYSGSEKTAFWGFDDSTGNWTFVPDATISGEVVSGSKGTLDVGSILNANLTDNRVVIAGTNGVLEDDANFTFDGTTLALTAAMDITGDLDVDNININGNTIISTDTNGNISLTPNGTGEVVISTATVSDLTANRVVLAGTSGALQDSANFTFNGSTMAITGAVDVTGDLDVDNININGNTIISTDTNGDVNITPNGTGETVISTAAVSDLTSGRIVTAGTSGALEDSASLLWDGTDLTAGSAIISDLTNNRVVIAGTSGALEDDANFTFDGTTLALTAGMDITGDLDVDNININGNTIISTDTNGDINLTPNGTGDVVVSTIKVSDLTSGRVTYASTSGALVDSANMTFDGTDLTVASAVVSDLTDNRLVVAGTSGALEDDANLTWSGTALAVTGGVDVTGDLDVDNININGNTIISTDTNGNINLTPNGTGEVVATTATVSDLTSGRVVLAGTSGAIEDSGNLTFDGTTLTVTGNIAVDNLDLDGNNITATSGGVVTINDAGADVDFRVEGDTNANLLVVDAGSDSVSIGTATQTADAIFKVGSTGSMMVPVGTTGERPGTGVDGMLRLNSSTNKLEYYANSEWKTADAEFTVIASDTFDGDGSTVAFTLGATQTTAGCIVSINGIVQLPTTAYGVSGTTLTFTEAPASGDKIEVRRLTTTTSIDEVEITANNTTDETTYILFADGATGAQAIESDTGLTYNPSSNTLTTTTFSGTATTAQYADLAEQYASDEDIEAGTVVHFAGNGKVAVCDSDSCTKVAGIVSTDPAHLMNSSQEGVPLALAGRVPCKVTGIVNAGDLMVSAGNGLARAEANPAIGTVIGKAIEDFSGEGEGVIEVLALMM